MNRFTPEYRARQDKIFIAVIVFMFVVFVSTLILVAF
jgi:ABC-type multidrug transport system permease subunit